MACCSDNNNCNCHDNECGCKTSSDEVVYIGPTLECTGIENCDTLTEVITKINTLLCGDDLVDIIVNNIINNETLLLQFTEIVNTNIDCETIWNCVTTTTTLCPCNTYKFLWNSMGGGTAAFVECGSDVVTTHEIDDILVFYCIDMNYPIIVVGNSITTNLGCCPITTTTTSTTFAPFYNLVISDTSYDNTGFACFGGIGAGTDIYTENATPIVGDFVYLDEDLTIPFDGGDFSWQIELGDTTSIGVTITSLGEITAQQIC